MWQEVVNRSHRILNTLCNLKFDSYRYYCRFGKTLFGKDCSFLLSVSNQGTRKELLPVTVIL